MSSLAELIETLHDHTNEVETIIAIAIASVSCCLSIFGSLLILGTYYFYPEIRKPARDLLFWLSVTDLGTALSYGMTFIQCGGRCDCPPIAQEVYTILGIYFPVSSFLWTDCIGLYIYAATYQKTWMAPRERLFGIFHIICWGLPMLTCVAIIILKALSLEYPIRLGGSATGGWCWIQQWQYDLLGGKVIEIFSYFFLLVCYVWTWKELKRINHRNIRGSGKPFSPTPQTYIHPTPSSEQNNASITNSKQILTNSMLKNSRADDMRKQLQHKSAAVNRLLFIPVVFFALRIWGTIHMFMDVRPSNNSGKYNALDIIDQTLAYFQALCDPLQGFCNGILFVVFVSEVRQHLYNTLQEHFGYKWVNCCGLICCCHYCFSCCCNKCNECFDSCLVRNNQSIQYCNKNTQNIKLFKNQSPNNGTSPLQTINTDYYASQYQFLPKESENNNQSSPSKSNSKSRTKSLVCKGANANNNYNSIINARHPTIESPSISSK